MKNKYLEAWIEEATYIPEKIDRHFSGLDEQILNQKPAVNKWSIGELLDHLMVTNTLYFPRFEKIIAHEHSNPFGARFTYLSSFFGQSIFKSVHPENPRKIKTVRKFQPVKKVFTLDKIKEFKDHHAVLMDFAHKTDAVDHKKIIITSPASALIFYSLEDAFRIILAHEQRHIQQAVQLLPTPKEMPVSS
ncbi:MAG: DinB family protein [Marinoscillum sp.]|uniref:DinB family protein n=1 Tax=Marinoscillum sp. TaxID=2024838 RepID=UPI0032FCA8C3